MRNVSLCIRNLSVTVVNMATAMIYMCFERASVTASVTIRNRSKYLRYNELLQKLRISVTFFFIYILERVYVMSNIEYGIYNINRNSVLSVTSVTDCNNSLRYSCLHGYGWVCLSVTIRNHP